MRNGSLRAGKNNGDGYRKVMIDGVFYQEHRIIFKMLSELFDESKLIDHIDCDTENNKIENLRLADKYQNMHNQSWPKRNVVTNIKGIDFLSDKGVFMARVQLMCKRFTKNFHDLDKAIEWITEKRTELHKDFLNHGQ